VLFRGLLQHSSKLQRLYFHWVRVDHVSAKMCDSLSMAIRNNSTLSCLRLDFCSADERAVPPAALLRVLEAIKVNTSLRSVGLELDGAISSTYSPSQHDLNAIGTGIADLIRFNSCLKDFNLVLSQDPSEWCVKRESVLVAAIKENFTMEFCNVRPIQRGGVSSSSSSSSSLVDIYARLNLHGRVYLKQGGGAQQKRGVELLIAVNYDLDCLFVHLLENPGLCCRTPCELLGLKSQKSEDSKISNPYLDRATSHRNKTL
jgi:hypothetical protein